jgi:hypothetical protein
LAQRQQAQTIPAAATTGTIADASTRYSSLVSASGTR